MIIILQKYDDHTKRPQKYDDHTKRPQESYHQYEHHTCEFIAKQGNLNSYHACTCVKYTFFVIAMYDAMLAEKT